MQAVFGEETFSDLTDSQGCLQTSLCTASAFCSFPSHPEIQTTASHGSLRTNPHQTEGFLRAGLALSSAVKDLMHLGTETTIYVN